MTKEFPGRKSRLEKNNNEERYLFIKIAPLFFGQISRAPFFQNKANILRYEPARRIFQTGLKKKEK